MKEKILLFGPLPPPITGQSKAFHLVCESIKDKHIINTTRFSSKIISTLCTIIQTLYFICTKNISKVYFTCSRSKLGGFRDILLLLLSRIRKIRVINHLHGFDFYHYSQTLNPFYRYIFNYAYEWVDTSIVLHDSMVKEFRDFKKMRIETVVNSYDRLLEIHDEIDVKVANKINILFLSNIMQSKGIFIFLEALKLLHKETNDFTVNIAGGFIDDYLMSSVDAKRNFYNEIGKLKQNGVDVNYLGTVYGEDKTKVLVDSDIFVLPTFHKTEAFPISIIEAMRTGCAIITTNHNIIPDIVSSHNGILAEPNSVNSLAECLKELLLNKKKIESFKKQNIMEAKIKYSPERYITEVIDIINR